MNDNEWWDLNVDRDIASAALKKAGISLLGWRNRKPVFAEGERIDWAFVEQLCSTAGLSSSQPEGPVSPSPTTGKRKKGRR